MNLLDLIEAIIKLGLPMTGLSWMLFNWVYERGGIDREADRQAIKEHVKGLKVSYKKAKKEKKKDNFFYDKWMWFGGGFYGLAGLWTFLVIEFIDIVSFLFNPSSIMSAFDDGLFSFIIGLIGNQISNIVSAFIWFTYWDADSIVVWLLVAYAGYWCGVELAKNNSEIPVRQWLEKIQNRD